MKYEEIQEMLNRYWEGETTLEEERSIKAYFNAGDIDERLRPIAAMFQAFREEQKVQLATKAKVFSIRPQIYYWAVAASVALVLTAGWCLLRQEKAVVPMANIPSAEAPKAVEGQMVETPKKALTAVEKVSPTTIPAKKKTSSKRVKPKLDIDPETAQAMAEIKAALALVSSKLDKGRTKAVKGATLLEAMDKVPRRKAG